MSDAPAATDPEYRAYWLSRLPEERLAEAERLRRVAHGPSYDTSRMERVARILRPGSDVTLRLGPAPSDARPIAARRGLTSGPSGLLHLTAMNRTDRRGLALLAAGLGLSGVNVVLGLLGTPLDTWRLALAGGLLLAGLVVLGLGVVRGDG